MIGAFVAERTPSAGTTAVSTGASSCRATRPPARGGRSRRASRRGRCRRPPMVADRARHPVLVARRQHRAARLRRRFPPRRPRLRSATGEPAVLPGVRRHLRHAGDRPADGFTASLRRLPPQREERRARDRPRRLRQFRVARQRLETAAQRRRASTWARASRGRAVPPHELAHQWGAASTGLACRVARAGPARA